MPQKSQCVNCGHCIVRVVTDFCKIKEIGLAYDKQPCIEYKKCDIEITKPSIFSFSGRINRFEYFISILISNVIGWMVGEISTFKLGFGLPEFLVILAWIWFILAQGSKRCHDIGNSGLWQFIPFYVFWMLLEKGNEGANSYGVAPK